MKQTFLDRYRKGKKEEAIRITNLLLAAQSSDAEARKNAESGLKICEEQCLSGFLLTLTLELSNDDKPLAYRRLVGIRLRNFLDGTTREYLQQIWLSFEESLRCQIKDSLLKTINSSISDADDTTAQIIARFASIDIPREEWPELVDFLIRNFTKEASLKPQVLDTFRHVCEEVVSNDIKDAFNLFVGAANVVDVTGQSSAHLAAATTSHSTQTDIKNRSLVDVIMKSVCKTAMAKESDIKKAVFKCLGSVASVYYEFLEPYMPTLFELTIDFEDEEIGTHSIEFWSCICDEEIRRTGNSCPHFFLIEKAKYSLIPKLLETLLKDGENGICNLSIAGGACLGLVARNIGDSILPLVMPIVQENLIKRDVVSRGAGAYAFGCILEGPSVEKLSREVLIVLRLLLNPIGNQNSYVKYTTAWTIGRIYKLLHSPASGFSIISLANLKRIIEVLLESIKDTPGVAENVCVALYYLTEGYEGFESGSSVLSRYLGDIINSLITAAEREDTNDSKLRSAAYKTLNGVVRCSNLSETSHIITHLLHNVTFKLNQTIESDDREKQGSLQALLCGVLLVIIQKLNSIEETKLSISTADKIMHLLMKVFDSGTIHKEAMLATGALMHTIGLEFNKYMDDFLKYLQTGLGNSRDYQVCSISVGVVSNMCKALGGNILPYYRDIMELLLKVLCSGELDRSVKPLIFTCFGDVALAIGKKFETYIKRVMVRMKEAGEDCAQIDMNNEKMVKYGKQLKMSILKGYSGIWKVLKTLEDGLTVTFAPQLYEFIEVVLKDPHRDERMEKEVVALLGDIAISLKDMSVFNLKMIG